MKLAIIIPVFNRPNEITELLESLAKQTNPSFQVFIIEDGSAIPCKTIVDSFKNHLDIQYHFKENTGPGASRNLGVELANADYSIFLDSDCILPPHYIQEVFNALKEIKADAFGGPDTAHPKFTSIQKAINFSMTSFITTGGIRGKENSMVQFQPRSFNMGISKEVYEKTGGFQSIFPGEDTHFSLRIIEQGFKTALFPKAFVYHKRRIDFKQFIKQVFSFGKARPILNYLHPKSHKWTFYMPSLFVLGLIFSIAIAPLTPFFIGVYILYFGFVFLSVLWKTKDLIVSFLTLVSTFLQHTAYGIGFLWSFWKIFILKTPPKKAFPDNFKWKKRN